MESEKQVEQHLVAKTKKYKGMAIKFPAKFNRSWPDRIILLPGGIIGFAELKGTNGKSTLGQLHIIQQLKDLGFTAEILNSRMKVDVFLRDLSKQKPIA